MDAECDPASHKLGAAAKQYLLIDTNVALHQVRACPGRPRQVSEPDCGEHDAVPRSWMGGTVPVEAPDSHAGSFTPMRHALERALRGKEGLGARGGGQTETRGAGSAGSRGVFGRRFGRNGRNVALRWHASSTEAPHWRKTCGGKDSNTSWTNARLGPKVASSAILVSVWRSEFVRAADASDDVSGSDRCV